MHNRRRLTLFKQEQVEKGKVKKELVEKEIVEKKVQKVNKVLIPRT